MKKLKPEILSRAYDAVKASDLFKPGTDILEKEYDGYVSSFGPAVINSGLLPALSFYTDIHKRSNKDPNKVLRYKVLRILFKVFAPNESNDDSDGLLQYVLSQNTTNTSELRAFRKGILEAAVAVKLAMRNFEHTDS